MAQAFIYTDSKRNAVSCPRAAWRKGIKKSKQPINAVFGPDETGKAGDHGGAIAFTDARILLFPVRSLVGVFAWVTSNHALKELQRYMAMAGKNPKQDNDPLASRQELFCHAHARSSRMPAVPTSGHP